MRIKQAAAGSATGCGLWSNPPSSVTSEEPAALLQREGAELSSRERSPVSTSAADCCCLPAGVERRVCGGGQHGLAMRPAWAGRVPVPNTPTAVHASTRIGESGWKSSEVGHVDYTLQMPRSGHHRRHSAGMACAELLVGVEGCHALHWGAAETDAGCWLWASACWQWAVHNRCGPVHDCLKNFCCRQHQWEQSSVAGRNPGLCMGNLVCQRLSFSVQTCGVMRGR